MRVDELAAGPMLPARSATRPELNLMATDAAVGQSAKLTVWVTPLPVLTVGTWVAQPVTVKSLPSRPVIASLKVSV